jgi:hypothetical protein
LKIFVEVSWLKALQATSPNGIKDTEQLIGESTPAAIFRRFNQC